MTAKRENLPPIRRGYTHKVRIGGQKIYLHTGEYHDGRLGEIFVTAAKTGTLLQSVLDGFAISVSLSLQHGVPLEEYVEAFKHTKFEPCGVVSGDSEIRMASSIFDWVFRELENAYLKKDEETTDDFAEATKPILPDDANTASVSVAPRKAAGAFSAGGGRLLCRQRPLGSPPPV